MHSCYNRKSFLFSDVLVLKDLIDHASGKRKSTYMSSYIDLRFTFNLVTNKIILLNIVKEAHSKAQVQKINKKKQNKKNQRLPCATDKIGGMDNFVTSEKQSKVPCCLSRFHQWQRDFKEGVAEGQVSGPDIWLGVLPVLAPLRTDCRTVYHGCLHRSLHYTLYCD